MVHQPSTAPGVETEIAAYLGSTPLTARERAVASESDCGDLPELAIATTLESFGSQMREKQSPPMPELTGSTRPSTAFAAMAASTAEPPRLRISMAVCVAMGCAVPAAPLQPRTGERVEKLAPDGRSPAWTSGRVKRSSPGAWNFGSGLVA